MLNGQITLFNDERRRWDDEKSKVSCIHTWMLLICIFSGIKLSTSVTIEFCPNKRTKS
jgi:hypothetical protein